MAELTANDFTKILMYGSPAEQSSDLFSAAGSDLEKKFTRGAPIRNSHRVEFRNYIDFVRLTAGLNVALDRLESTRDTGLAPELYATAGMVTARRANDYYRAAQHMARAFELWPDNETVREFLIESYMSIARFGLAAELFFDFTPSTEQSAVRFGNLAAAIGRWDLVEHVVDPWVKPELPFEIQVLLERVRISEGFRGQSDDITAYVLNMPSDTRKLDLVSTHLKNLDVNMERQPGINARELSEAERAAAGRSRLNLGIGAVGCALGHIAMWERFLAGSDSFCLMMEDDAYPFVQRDIGRIIDEAASFDVLFVHSGMSLLRSGGLRHGFTSVWEALQKRETGGGWGAYGYVLSRSGAEKLVDAIRVDKITGHIDGQLASYGIDPHAEATSIGQKLGRAIHSKSASKTSLDIKCTAFPLIGSIDFGDSSIGRMGGHSA